MALSLADLIAQQKGEPDDEVQVEDSSIGKEPAESMPHAVIPKPQEPIPETPPDRASEPNQPEDISASESSSQETPLADAPSFSPEELKKFRNAVEAIPELFNEKDALANVIRTVVMELQNHPEFEDHLAPEEMGKMVDACRHTLGMVQISKAEKRAKTGGRKKAKSPALELSMGELANLDMGELS